jgi:hypothetical protein
MAGLILQKQVAGDWHFVQSLQPIPVHERGAYLAATYGKRAAQFRIVQDGPRMTAAQERADYAAFVREVGPPSAPCPSAASLILAKLHRGTPTPI